MTSIIKKFLCSFRKIIKIGKTFSGPDVAWEPLASSHSENCYIIYSNLAKQQKPNRETFKMLQNLQLGESSKLVKFIKMRKPEPTVRISTKSGHENRNRSAILLCHSKWLATDFQLAQLVCVPTASKDRDYSIDSSQQRVLVI